MKEAGKSDGVKRNRKIRLSMFLRWLCAGAIFVGVLQMWRSTRPRFIEATVTFQQVQRHPEIRGGSSVVLNDERTIAELMSYFDGAGRSRASIFAGGWVTGVQVVFTTDVGEIVEVHVSDDLTEFSDQSWFGDGKVLPGFEQFITTLPESIQD